MNRTIFDRGALAVVSFAIALAITAIGTLLIDRVWNALYFPVSGKVEIAHAYTQSYSRRGVVKTRRCIEVQYSYADERGANIWRQRLQSTMPIFDPIICNANLDDFEPSIDFQTLNTGRFQAGAAVTVWINRLDAENTALVRNGLMPFFAWAFVVALVSLPFSKLLQSYAIRRRWFDLSFAKLRLSRDLQLLKQLRKRAIIDPANASMRYESHKKSVLKTLATLKKLNASRTCSETKN